MSDLVAEVRENVGSTVANVHEMITDPSRLHQWISGVQEGDWLDDGVAEAGARFGVKYRYRRHTNDITFEVREADPGRTYVYETVEGPYPIRASFTLEEQGGGALVTYEQHARGDSIVTSAMFRYLGFLLRRPVRKQLRKDLVRLAVALASPGPEPENDESSGG